MSFLWKDESSRLALLLASCLLLAPILAVAFGFVDIEGKPPNGIVVTLACVAHLPSIMAAVTLSPIVTHFSSFSFFSICVVEFKIVGCTSGTLFSLLFYLFAFMKFSERVLGPRTSILELLVRQRSQYFAHDHENNLQTVEIAKKEEEAQRHNP